MTMKKPRFELWQPDEFGDHRKVTRETWDPRKPTFPHDGTNQAEIGWEFDVVDLANEAEEAHELLSACQEYYRIYERFKTTREKPLIERIKAWSAIDEEIEGDEVEKVAAGFNADTDPWEYTLVKPIREDQ